MSDDRVKVTDDNKGKDLYDPSFEHDSCGIGFLVDIKGRKSHKIIEQALIISKNICCSINTDITYLQCNEKYLLKHHYENLRKFELNQFCHNKVFLRILFS